jgi:hypothetical protein
MSHMMNNTCMTRLTHDEIRMRVLCVFEEMTIVRSEGDTEFKSIPAGVTDLVRPCYVSIQSRVVTQGHTYDAA